MTTRIPALLASAVALHLTMASGAVAQDDAATDTDAVETVTTETVDNDRGFNLGWLGLLGLLGLLGRRSRGADVRVDTTRR